MFSPSHRSIFDYIQEERQVIAKERHVTPDSVFPFKETTLREMMIKLGYAYEDSGDDRERLKQQEHVMEHRELRRSNATLHTGPSSRSTRRRKRVMRSLVTRSSCRP